MTAELFEKAARPSVPPPEPAIIPRYPQFL
jgi:hypothetical protein